MHWKLPKIDLRMVLCLIMLLPGLGARGQVTTDRTTPVIKSLPTPEYPAAAKTAGIGGDVTVVVLVDKTGVGKVVDSYGPKAPCADLNGALATSVRQAAVDAAMRATFLPATFKGKQVDKGLEI